MEKLHAFQSRDGIFDEAYTWVLIFNADASVTDDDIVALNEWANRSPAHRQALKDAEDFWCEAELLSQLAVPVQQVTKQRRLRGLLGGIFATSLSVNNRGTVMLSYSRVFSAVLLLGVSIALALSLIPIEASVGNGIYSTVVGEQKLITLVDASQVHLDTHSQIRVAYEEDVRKIYLLHGKAHFSVAENPDRPFEVYASSGLVRAVGTAFSVYLVDSDIEVIVNEGRVELARFVPGSGVDILPVDDDQRSTNGLSQPVAKELPGKGTLRKGTLRDDATANELIPDNRSSSGKVFMSLGQGQGVKFSQTQQALIQLSDRDLSNKLAWRKGALVFVRVPLVDIVAEIGRYTNVKVEIVDPALRDLVMGGRFRVGELDALFDVLDIGFGVQVSYLNENHVQLHFATDG